MVRDPKDGFRRLYEAYGREELAQAGRAHLGGDLRLHARRLTRRFWLLFGCAVALAVWLAVLGAVWLLERAGASAEGFERQRRERLERLDDGG